MAVVIGVAPFSIPVSADDTRCSAKGKRLSGNASHRHPSRAVGHPSPGASGRRAAGTSDRQAKPDRDSHEGDAGRGHRLEPLRNEEEGGAPDGAGDHEEHPVEPAAMGTWLHDGPAK